MATERHWWAWLILLLVIEKVVQHMVVTVAFYTDWQQIGASVAVNPALLMIAGGILALLFMVACWAVFTHKRWALDLVMLLALVDIVGEYYAQGRFAIDVNVSFVVAWILVLLVIAKRRAWRLVTP